MLEFFTISLKVAPRLKINLLFEKLMNTTQTNGHRTVAGKLPKQPIVRFQVELLLSRLDHVAAVMAKAGIRTKREFFDNAFSFLAWAIEESVAGNTVGVLLPDKKTFLAWKTPVLEVARINYEQTSKNRCSNGHEAGPPEVTNSSTAGDKGDLGS